MRKSALAVMAVLAVGIVAGALVYSRRSASSVNADSAPSAAVASPQLATIAQPQPGQTAAVDGELNERLKTLCAGAGGDVGVAVIHVETGRSVDIEGAKPLPLYSVFKLPVAITVLQEVEEKRLSLDQKVRVTPEDVSPGAQFNTDLWSKPVEKTVAELLELAIVRSDNTSGDKLLGLIGGPATVTKRMRALGFANIDIKFTSREFAAHRDKPNTGTASDLARLLAKLQQGELAQPPHLALLIGFMERAMTGGERRLRADLPAGTQVADKTGTGAPGSSTNDVGLITLPDGKGHLAIAVLINQSKLTTEAQEKLIAQLARAAYDYYVSQP